MVVLDRTLQTLHSYQLRCPRIAPAHARRIREQAEAVPEWVRVTQADGAPDQIAARDVLTYMQHLGDVRGNGDSAVNRAVVVVRRFYCAMVAMGHLNHRDNPLVSFPSIKAVPRELLVTLSFVPSRHRALHLPIYC